MNKNVASATTGSTGPGWGINMKKKRSSQPLSRKARRAAEGSDPLGPVMGGVRTNMYSRIRKGHGYSQPQAGIGFGQRKPVVEEPEKYTPLRPPLAKKAV